MSARPGLRKWSISEDVTSPTLSTEPARNRKLLQDELPDLNLSTAVETQSRILRSGKKSIAYTKFLPDIEVSEPSKPRKKLRTKSHLQLKFPQLTLDGIKTLESKQETSKLEQDQATDTDVSTVLPSVTMKNGHGSGIEENHKICHEEEAPDVEKCVKKAKRKKRVRKPKIMKDEPHDEYFDFNEDSAEDKKVNLLKTVETQHEDNCVIYEESPTLTQKATTKILKSKRSKIASPSKFEKTKDVTEATKLRKVLRAKRHFKRSKNKQENLAKTSTELKEEKLDTHFDFKANDNDVIEKNLNIHHNEDAPKVEECIKKPKRKKRSKSKRTKNETHDKNLSFKEDELEGVVINYEAAMEDNFFTHQDAEGTEIKKYVKSLKEDEFGPEEIKMEEEMDDKYLQYSEENSDGESSRKEPSKIADDVLSVSGENNDDASKNGSCTIHRENEGTEITNFSFDKEVEESHDNLLPIEIVSQVTNESNQKNFIVDQQVEEVEGGESIIKRTYSINNNENVDILPNTEEIPIVTFVGNSARKRKSYTNLSKAAREIIARRDTEKLFKFEGVRTDKPRESPRVSAIKKNPTDGKSSMRQSSVIEILDETFDCDTSTEIFANQKLSTSKLKKSLEIISSSADIDKMGKENRESYKFERTIKDFKELKSENISPSIRSGSKFEESAVTEMSPSTGDNTHENFATPTVITNRRRTYELEDSITEISLLKSVAKSEKKSSVSSTDETSFERRAVNMSKVTLRREFNTNASYSPIELETLPKDFWLINDPDETVDTTNLENSSTSSKSKNSDGRKPTRTSTPKMDSKPTSLLKKTLEKSTVLRLNQSNPSTSKKSKVKVPNFSLIHQRAFDKMESVLEYKQRKEDRAKFLLSGQKLSSKKTQITTEARNQSSNSTKSIKKQLRFASDVIDVKKPADFIPLPSTPLPRRQIRQNQTTPGKAMKTSATPMKTSVEKKTETPKKVCVHIPENQKSPRVKEMKKILTPKKTPVKKFETPKKIYVNDKENKSVVFQHNPFDFKSRQQKDGFTRYGFKLRPEVKKEEHKQVLKAIVNKTVVVKNTTNNRREILKGVRSNRRFDLLMQMRNK